MSYKIIRSVPKDNCFPELFRSVSALNVSRRVKLFMIDCDHSRLSSSISNTEDKPIMI